MTKTTTTTIDITYMCHCNQPTNTRHSQQQIEHFFVAGTNRYCYWINSLADRAVKDQKEMNIINTNDLYHHDDDKRSLFFSFSISMLVVVIGQSVVKWWWFVVIFNVCVWGQKLRSSFLVFFCSFGSIFSDRLCDWENLFFSVYRYPTDW